MNDTLARFVSSNCGHTVKLVLPAKSSLGTCTKTTVLAKSDMTRIVESSSSGDRVTDPNWTRKSLSTPFSKFVRTMVTMPAPRQYPLVGETDTTTGSPIGIGTYSMVKGLEDLPQTVAKTFACPGTPWTV